MTAIVHLDPRPVELEATAQLPLVDCSTRTEVIYIAPSAAQPRVYAIPGPLRPGVNPRDIQSAQGHTWKEIGLLNFELDVVCLEPAYADLAEEIRGQMGGVYFSVERPARAPRQEA